MQVMLVVFVVFAATTYGQSLHALSIRAASVEESKIVGGAAVPIEKYPFMVHLETFIWRTLSSTCDGTILSDKFVMSAAHCLYKSTYSVVYMGSANIKGRLHYTSTRHRIHEQYNAESRDYDVGVVIGSLPLDGATAKAVLLPRAGSAVPAGAVLEVVGWGSTSESDTNGVSQDLNEVSVPVVDFATCQNLYKNKLTTRMFCAGDTTSGGKGPCYTDAGGPAVKDGVQLGILSTGNGCGHRALPGVFTDVAAIVPWLTTVMAER